MLIENSYHKQTGCIYTGRLHSRGTQHDSKGSVAIYNGATLFQKLPNTNLPNKAFLMANIYTGRSNSRSRTQRDRKSSTI